MTRLHHSPSSYSSASYYESSLHASIPDSEVKNLLPRLSLLCAESFSPSPSPQSNDPVLQSLQNSLKFTELELIFVPSIPTPPGPARSDDVLLRLRCVIQNDDVDLENQHVEW
ncbi:hypothetical protein BKA69DRAFT_1051806 [Paraphysoderma sedebokerense]|nr:hypothetical protein BKA69DRAFT_1051806 [Paraphysoderma sedebokerense]